MRVDVEEVQKLIEQVKRLNSLDFDEIEWYNDGRKLEFSNFHRNSWLFMGMSNIDFVRYDFYTMTDDDLREVQEEVAQEDLQRWEDESPNVNGV